MNVLSLFDGMSCGQVALRELGIIPDIYYASEIDKHAITQTQLNFPNTVQLGNVTGVDVSKLKRIDLLIGGSPCQSFSFAGKRAGMAAKIPTEKQLSDLTELKNAGWDIDENEFIYSKSERVEIYTLDHYLELKSGGFEFEGESYLFWEYMRILADIRKYNPDILFLLENVEMGYRWERILSETIGIYGVHINSALVSAQNRKRIYWTNIRIRREGLLGEFHSDIPQPENEGILLRDILECEVDEKYYIKNSSILNRDPKINPEKSYCVSQKNNAPGGASSRRTSTLIIDKQFHPKSNQNKASCFTAAGISGGNHSDMDLICVAMRGRNPDNPTSRKPGLPTKQMIEVRPDGKKGALTSVQKDNLIVHNLSPRSSKTGKGGSGPLSRNDGKSYCLDTGRKNAVELIYQLNPSTESGGKQPYQQNRVYADYGKMINLDLDKRKNVETGNRIRRLTPTECDRLQTIPPLV